MLPVAGNHVPDLDPFHQKQHRHYTWELNDRFYKVGRGVRTNEYGLEPLFFAEGSADLSHESLSNTIKASPNLQACEPHICFRQSDN